MYVVITIAGDPTSWWTDNATDATALAAELARGPANVPIIYPVKGNLLISAKASVTILDVPPSQSWIPSGGQAPVATLYVQAAPTAEFSGYTLPVGTNLDELQKEILATMAKERAFKVLVSSGTDHGIAVLNGASLTFAVVCPPPS